VAEFKAAWPDLAAAESSYSTPRPGIYGALERDI